jgi:DNA polymerase I-like protein with 3'-5' exonuclease and polymerase domains
MDRTINMKTDIYTAYAATLLNVGMSDVTMDQRRKAKQMLFKKMYSGVTNNFLPEIKHQLCLSKDEKCYLQENSKPIKKLVGYIEALEMVIELIEEKGDK